jgi:hypothetical protein
MIVGYFHICQKGDWQRSFDLIFGDVLKHGLYALTSEIRIGVVSENAFVDDKRFHDPKFKIVYKGHASEYERPTLLNMRSRSETDADDTKYWYVHSKGLKHFGTPSEVNVIDWIKLMLYWNVEQHKLALQKLETFDTYGCNAIGTQHYSGNFWWSKAAHIKKLPVTIPGYYIAPEDWICTVKNKMCCIFYSGLQGMGHYTSPYPEHLYRSI